MNKTREAILSRLRASRQSQVKIPARYQPDYGWSQQQKVDRLFERMTAVRTEVVILKDDNWIDWINQQLPQRGLHRILVGNNEIGESLHASASDALQIKTYDENIEHWKEELFNRIDVGITSTKGGIAESGSLIVWPDAAEPRLMSLVPSVHIALLQADKIYQNFAEAMETQQWSRQMPTNALLISGPSKTADIEQTLAYGIHGPQQLIVLLLNASENISTKVNI